MTPEPALVDRFRADLDALAPVGARLGARLGIAVSGGPDSLALLLLAAAARPGTVEAATVDHALRSGSRDEAEAVAGLCGKLGIPHAILTIDWRTKPETAIQERARAERYRLLAGWARDRGLDAILTGHHADDQAETLLMRLSRGAGVRGLAGMRPRSTVPGTGLPLLRPLLGWRRSDLEATCADASLDALADPSNSDPRFERVRIRRALAQADWLDPANLAASARHLADADQALDWAADREWRANATEQDGAIVYRPSEAPPEIVRRLVARAVAALAHEAAADPLRARELDPLLAALRAGKQATLRGVHCAAGPHWRFSQAPERRR